MNFEDFIKTKQDQEPHKPDHPKGFRPGIEWDGRKGTITTKGLHNQEDLDWDAWIDYWLGVGASKTFFIRKGDPINFRVWDAWGKNPITGESEPTKFYYFKANLYSRENTVPDEDIERLVQQVKRKKAPERKKVKHKAALVIGLADWQIGKPNTEKAVDAYFKSIYSIVDNLSNLRRKYTIEKLVLCGMGDLLENCSNNFSPTGLFEQEFDNRQQMKIARRMLVKTIEILAPKFTDITVMCCFGNHGQKRQGKGNFETSYGDNLDGELFENVSEIFAKAPAYKHVKWIIPENDLTLSVQVLPNVVLSIHHGHSAKSGQNAQAKVVNWFRKMASNKSQGQMYDTNVLMVGHFHHHFSVEVDERLIIGCAAHDHSGQQYFAETGGGSALPGTTAFLLHSTKGRKWSDINIY